jgi:site-specific DNA-methyltransferase (adenine-specific)
MTWRIITADCTEAMREMEPASVDAIVTDPPYGLEFMGKEWDRLGATVEAFEESQVNGRTDYHGKGNAPFGGGGQRVRFGTTARTMQQWHHTWATEALRVLKPGGHLLAFGGTRTIHRLVSAIEDAGFEIRDMLSWNFGSGFPKSRNFDGDWQGWGTALKPAWEGITLARKPLSGTVAANVLEFGTGALNIDGTRIDPGSEVPGGGGWLAHQVEATEGWDRPYVNGVEPTAPHSAGRWPANVILDEDAAAMLDEQTGERPGFSTQRDLKSDASKNLHDGGWGGVQEGVREGFNDNGGASRFFYCPKADREEREIGLAGHDYQVRADVMSMNAHDHEGGIDGRGVPYKIAPVKNNHPTVKPVALMQWLCRLITPPGGTVLDPFTGSGTTGMAACREGFDFIGIEREPEYVEIARARIFGDAPLFNVESS